jgi:hypothetical protein
LTAATSIARYSGRLQALNRKEACFDQNPVESLTKSHASLATHLIGTFWRTELSTASSISLPTLWATVRWDIP